MTEPAVRGGLGIRGSFYAAIGTMTVLVLLFSVIGGVLLERSSQAFDTLVDRIGPANTALVDMEDALVDEETGVRGYLLTRQSDFLQPYSQGEAQETTDLAQIKTLLAGRPKALADVAAAQDGVAAWKNTYALPFIAQTRAGGTVGDAALTASKNSFDRLRILFATAQARLSVERAAAQANLNHLDRIRDWTFSAMLAAFLVTVCLIVGLVQMAVLRPLTRLRLEAEAVTEGSFDAPITATGPRDIRALGEALAAMRGRLTRALAAAEHQRTALNEQKEVLDKQASELRRSNEELEQFAYVASHDLQEPLRKVASFCQLIERRYGEVLDERGKQYIDYAVDGAKRMQVLINDLLTFSRVGRFNERRERVDLQAAVADALDGLQYAIDESGAVVRVDGPLPAVTGDPTLIRMLLQNLVGNSIKFRTPGTEPEIDIAWEPDPEQEGFVRLSVADKGIGIAPEFGEKVFVIFQRLHSREAYTGTGIGLALCKKIVEYHDGRIALDPARSPGTRIFFTLPAADPAATGPQAADVEESAQPPAPGPGAEPAERVSNQ
jgi:signal transduction histidine kinase